MRKTSFVISVVALLVAAASVNAAVLFSDNFNRANNVDISAESAGMGGDLAPLSYVEQFEGSGQGSSIQIMNEQLDIAVGVGSSSFYLDYNFTDAAILAEGGFSVSMDVTSITSADDQRNRFGGFGVGNTLSDVQTAADPFDATSYRGVVGRDAVTGITDFYIDLALDNNLRVWNNGVIVNTMDVGASAGTIKVDFLVSDFMAGSAVTANIFFDGALQGTQDFTWDNDDANYIGISGRTAGAGVFLDNLEVATVPEPATMVLLGLGGLALRRRRK